MMFRLLLLFIYSALLCNFCMGLDVTEQPPVVASVLLPTFRRPHLLRHCLQQLAKSTQQGLEIVVIDDSSQMDNVNELESFLAPDQTLVYHHSKTRLSIGTKRNLAVDLSSGMYLIQVDDDDWYSPSRIAYQLEPLVKGQADMNVLTQDYWAQVDPKNDTPYYYQVTKEAVRNSPHYGTLAFTRSLWDSTTNTNGVRYPDTSFAEDRSLYEQVKRHGAKVLELPNQGHHVYVRHASATNHIHNDPSVDASTFRQVAQPEWLKDIEALSRYLNLDLQFHVTRQLKTDCGCCVNANICKEYEEAWDMYDCPLHEACPDVEFWENKLGPCDSCASGISCEDKYGSYDGCLDLGCGCCANANVCLEFEDAWDLYGCSLSGGCPDVEFWETEYGPCDSCASGISCEDKYGSYDGCLDLGCGCCSNANVCLESEDAWDLYGCPLSGGCPDVEFWENKLGPCDSCASGISCKDKYGSYDGCYDSSCGCCVNANICLESEDAWDLYGCPLSGGCPDVEFWETEYGPCDSCASGISCEDKYGSYDACHTSNYGCCARANLFTCLEFENAWDLYGCSLSGDCPEIQFWEMEYGPCDSCPSGISCKDKYDWYDYEFSPVCGCCVRARTCEEYKEAWDIYNCLLYKECPDVEFVEAQLGPCNSCYSGVSCEEKYGSYDGCVPSTTEENTLCLESQVCANSLDKKRYRMHRMDTEKQPCKEQCVAIEEMNRRSEQGWHCGPCEETATARTFFSSKKASKSLISASTVELFSASKKTSKKASST